MRISFLLVIVAIGACSSSHEQNDAHDAEGEVTLCVTEEMLREANVSEAEIRQFKKNEAKDGGQASCG